mmetsp:Transcript_10595/g.31544  ORF Transcript_10595/g.31544 Transcript_10595/m.31544 type:complete len:361 (+) Transcript_10595:174-1256(+)
MTSSMGVLPKVSSMFTSTPPTPRRKLTVVTSSLDAARWRALRPKASCAFTEQRNLKSRERWSRSAMATAWLMCTASSNVPSSAPWRRSRSAHASARERRASCKGVTPPLSRAFTSAFFSIKSLAPSTLPLAAAVCSGVRWSPLRAFTSRSYWQRSCSCGSPAGADAASHMYSTTSLEPWSPPALARNSAASLWPWMRASLSGVFLRRSSMLTLARDARSKAMICVLPPQAARCSADRPSKSVMSMSRDLEVRRRFTFSASPLAHAVHRRECATCCRRFLASEMLFWSTLMSWCPAPDLWCETSEMPETALSLPTELNADDCLLEALPDAADRAVALPSCCIMTFSMIVSSWLGKLLRRSL